MSEFIETVHYNTDPIRSSYGICGLHTRGNRGCREWVIDIDLKTDDPELANFVLNVSVVTSMFFFGTENIKVYHTGNDGIHIWLNPANFPVDSSAELRGFYLAAMQLPKGEEELHELVRTTECRLFCDADCCGIDCKPKMRIIDTPPNPTEPISFAECFVRALCCNETYMNEMTSIIRNNRDVVSTVTDVWRLFWPPIDAGLFQSPARLCRAPLSYHLKGGRLSRRIDLDEYFKND
ncbi:CUN045 putative lef-1 late expression factor 1, similar to AcMNPV ORF14 [Culex nigripalpus nucleopolyhedrovirus]|uniref:CUN045 putative lef-1 late expression factor 1, similar to AcMNPV ORF14 n=2 Tax=Deltabaculovirus TaxID=558019 RepID=Q77GU6_NPVCO|nr:CUN045 putative lef-1 late expression factor 1, similar to AcMNPV ORF14 [Culex nigripalpus nucleopolyhedrovirus]AAK13260.1 putative late expression factor 1 [Culex nigripalpus nucleopolyhedrovirus]AAK94123.1 CUN045 putative lef-1 late expression factor 1, similar to AcMNPV ORF14 [Culex nigripalpus nucleopolyhedrovirus]